MSSSSSTIDLVYVDPEKPCVTCQNKPDSGARVCPTTKARIKASNGQANVNSRDLSWSGLGFSWGCTRSYANLVKGGSYPTAQGPNWFNSSQPYLVFTHLDTVGQVIGMITGVSSSIWFAEDGMGGWMPLYGSIDQLRFDLINNQYVVTDNDGNKNTFHSDDGSLPQSLRGRLKGMQNPAGARGQVVYNVDYEITSMEWTDISGQKAVFRYEYIDTLPLLGLLKSIVLEVDGRPVQRARYSYAAASSSIATEGDLQIATVEKWTGTNWAPVTEEAYRYYVEGDAGGFAHGLKMLFDPQSVADIRLAGLDPILSPESQLTSYADRWFAYNTERRVVETRLNGGAQVYYYDWMSAIPKPAYSDVNTWNRRCVETLPDGNRNTYYTNCGGAMVLHIQQDVSTGNRCSGYPVYNPDYRVTTQSDPSAVQDVTEPSSPTDPLIVQVYPNTGLVHVNEYYDYDDFASGFVRGWLKSERVQQGEFGAPELLRERTYDTQTVGSVTIHQIWQQWEYPVAGVPQSDAALTTYERDYFEDDLGNPTFQVQQLITTPPVIDATQHGTDQPEPSTQIFDVQGRVTWQRNARGYISFSVYDQATGALIQSIQDVDTSLASGVPFGWATPEGGGLNLITDYENDTQGRNLRTLAPWIEVDPATVNTEGDAPLKVRPVSYTYYRDALHQVWSASGYMTDATEGASWHIIGPVSIAIMDASGRTTDQIQAPPGCACGPLGPDTFNGSGNLPPQSQWSRWNHSELDLMGRVVESRVYHSIPASGNGFAGTNYNATFYSYDDMGRQFRTESPGGTISWTVYDARELRIGSWIGTNDNGATSSDPSGGGASGNNMKQVWLGVYDNGSGVGDGNLTQETRPVDDNSANDRITLYAYDYRNRMFQTTTNDGTRDYFDVIGYDNLDRAIEQARYHTSVDTSNHTHDTTTSYDDRGRTYEQKRYFVHSDGTLGDSLVSGQWYDPNGNTIKQTQQGALVVAKMVFDSLDRPVIQYQVSEDSSTSGTNTNSVALDTVISQGENLYNDASFLLAMTSRARFDDAAGTGPLQGPNDTEPRARLSYSASYLDPVGRLRFSANYGTNGGAAWAYPPLHATPSALVLVTEQRYAVDGGALSSIDPQGIVTAQERDQAGRSVRVIENASGAEDTQRESGYQYASDSGMLRLILENPTTGQQVTAWAYGTTLSDSFIARSDLPVRKTYPTGESEFQTYNRQSEVQTKTDANGSVHAYNRDLLGRLIDDMVTVLGAGVDGLLRRVSTSYDERGRVQYVTTADDPTPGAGSVINQVEYNYNGIDCLTSDAQSHAGSVDGSTPAVQYQCTAATNQVLRRTTLIYPNGRAVNYEYSASGSIDDVLNRVQSLHDDDLTVLAEYNYLGAAQPAVTTI